MSDQYSSLATKIYNRSISEDIFSIVVCILLLHFFIKERQPQEEKPQEQRRLSLDSKLCRIHQFTQRETEIFALLLSHQNQSGNRRSALFFHWERSKPMFITFLSNLR